MNINSMISEMKSVNQANNAASAKQAQLQREFQSAESQKMRDFNMSEAEKNRSWQEAMSNTAHQRQVEDLKKAGLNPILSANSGASVGSGSQASQSSSPQGAKGEIDMSLVQAMASMAMASINSSATLAAASMQAEAQKFAASQAAAASRYASDNAYKASIFGSSSNYLGTKYSSDKSYAASNERNKYTFSPQGAIQYVLDAAMGKNSSFEGLLSKAKSFLPKLF